MHKLALLFIVSIAGLVQARPDLTRPAGAVAPLVETTAAPTTTPKIGDAGQLWGQCGGFSYTGPTVCVNSICTVVNSYYSQCKPLPEVTTVPVPGTPPGGCPTYSCAGCPSGQHPTLTTIGTQCPTCACATYSTTTTGFAEYPTPDVTAYPVA